MINKNKEEIEKILILINQGKSFCKRNNFNQKSYEYLDLVIGREFQFQVTIKTSILWCEDEIEFINDIINLWDLDAGYSTTWEKLEQLKTHLTWLKEQEKELNTEGNEE